VWGVRLARLSLGARLAVVVGMFAIAGLAGVQSASASLVTPSADPTALAAALSAQPGLVAGASWVSGSPSSPSANGVRVGSAGSFFPSDGPSFAVMTTGSVANADPPNDTGSKGTDNGTSQRGANDVSILRVNVNVPQGANCLGLDLAFYSEEFPEFVGSRFNDALLVELDDNSWTYDSATNSVNSPKNFAFDTNGSQLTVNTALVSPLDTGLQYDGSTDLLTARTPVTSGPHSLYFSIYDAGDHRYDSAAFFDNLRSFNLPASLCTPGAKRADTDGDGIPDDMERNGIDTNGDGRPDVNLPAMGANPNHKDVFVQLDSMRGHQLDPAALQTVINSFANAPMSNPDGRTGITLHIDAGPNSIMNPITGARWRSRSQAHVALGHRDVLGAFSGSNYNWSAFDAIKNANFDPNRAPAFRYAVSIHQYGSSSNGSSGIARGIPASDFIVALGRTCRGGVDCTVGGTGGQAGTFMHELGHTLGLGHGGSDGINFKPNYPSIMDYSFQFGGLLRSASPTVPSYDYSRYGPTSLSGTVAPLNEAALSETAGAPATGGAVGLQGARYCPGSTTPRPFTLGSGSVDWNCNGSISNTVSASVNQDSVLSVLSSFDDWANIKFKGGSIGGLGLSSLLPGATENLDTVSTTQLQRTAAALAGDSKAPKLRAGNRRHIRRRRLTLTAIDNRRMNQIQVVLNGRKLVFTITGKSNKLVAKLHLRHGRNTIIAIAIDALGNQSRGLRISARA
jgi:hypothetical protein